MKVIIVMTRVFYSPNFSNHNETCWALFIIITIIYNFCYILLTLLTIIKIQDAFYSFYLPGGEGDEDKHVKTLHLEGPLNPITIKKTQLLMNNYGNLVSQIFVYFVLFCNIITEFSC